MFNYIIQKHYFTVASDIIVSYDCLNAEEVLDYL